MYPEFVKLTSVNVKRLLLAVRNSYLVAPESLFHAVVKDGDFTNILEGGLPSNQVTVGRKVLGRLIPWFWP